jgi:hypothetical protein
LPAGNWRGIASTETLLAAMRPYTSSGPSFNRHGPRGIVGLDFVFKLAEAAVGVCVLVGYSKPDALVYPKMEVRAYLQHARFLLCFFLTHASQTKTILLAILIAESENEISIASFLRATKAAVRSEVQILREVLLAFARPLSMHSMLTIVFVQGLRAKREIVEKLLEQHSTETDPLQNMIAWNLDAFLSSYMRNPVLRRNPWPEVHIVSLQFNGYFVS